MDWDEEFALQDFLKSEISEKYCRIKEGRVNSKSEETADKLTDRGEEDGEEKWMVVDPAGDGEGKEKSVPLCMEAAPGKGAVDKGQGEGRHEGGLLTFLVL